MDSIDKKQKAPARDNHDYTDTELKRRRERGRAAQAAFRKRQTDTIQSQEHQIRTFNRAFRTMNQACYRLKLAAQLSSTMGNGDISAPLINEIIDLMEQACNEVLDIQPQFDDVAEASKAGQKALSLRQGKPTTELNSLVPSQDSTGMGLSLPPVIEEFTKWNFLNATENVPSSSLIETRFGDRIRRASVPIPSNKPATSITLRLPPNEVMPYLPRAPSGQQTFAGKLYWTTVSIAFNLLSSQPEQVLRGYPMFDYHIRHHSYESLRRRVGLLLAIHRSGHIYEDINPELSLRLIQLCTKDAAEAGLPLERYLDAREVELHLRRKFIDPDNLHLNTLAGLVNESTAEDVSNTMLTRLSERAICLGDGPKYLIDDVDTVFDSVTGGLLLPLEMDPQVVQEGYAIT